MQRTFASLRHRNYRLLWIGTVVSQSGDWMDQIALNWLVYQITGSPIALGILNLFRFLPILVFTLVGGVMADRWERRTILVTTQTAAMLMAFILAILVSTGVVQFWMVLIIAVGRGIMMSFNQPARQTLISDLVPRSDLMNAIALNAATMNLTRIIGPAIGGLLISTIGVAGAFYANGASFLAVLVGLAMMEFPKTRVRVRQGMMTELFGGIRYIIGEPRIRSLILLALVPMVLGMPYMTMLTVFAQDVLDVGSQGLGLLTAASGLGALAGALFVASLGEKRGRRRMMLIGLMGFGIMLIIFSLSQWLWVSALALIGVGICQQLYMSLNNTMIQESVDDEYRGRVLSTLFLNRGMVPLGAMIAGVGAAAVGAPLTTAVMAGLLLVLGIVTRLPRPQQNSTS